MAKESWESVFAFYGVEPLRLSYEQIAAGPLAAAARVAAYSGLDLDGQEHVEKFDDVPLKSQAAALNSA